MQSERISRYGIWVLLLAFAGALTLPAAYGNSCTTQAQMTPAQREELSRVAHALAGKVQSGDIQGLRNDTAAVVAADFSGIAKSAEALHPLIQQAGITVDHLLAFDVSPGSGGNQRAQFFCSPAGSTKTVVLNFSDLSPGKYALAILHATGVPKPQQISLVLSETPANQWKLAGFFNKPMMLDGRNGSWYWSQAREYAQKKMDWPAWFYYQVAAFLVEPVNFLSSPNLQKLQHEAEQVRPQNLPGDISTIVNANGHPFAVTRVGTSTELGPLDFVIHYSPNAEQSAELRNPVAARKQVIDLMTGMLELHLGLREAFHGVWVYADAGNVTVFALELPMAQIPGASHSAASSPAFTGKQEHTPPPTRAETAR